MTALLTVHCDQITAGSCTSPVPSSVGKREVRPISPGKQGRIGPPGARLSQHVRAHFQLSEIPCRPLHWSEANKTRLRILHRPLGRPGEPAVTEARPPATPQMGTGMRTGAWQDEPGPVYLLPATADPRFTPLYRGDSSPPT
ncbi:hypothetical protein SKAU_G00252550 [Synaphobranchus kaupii]|uniref:Uncharacterized protein n=1 Tax=Synaphobranchus kaupii TaxID=118154 RepID=A0A9Q1F3E8_SYNKA|nr:hypothetical protein SKAU_G00252550 [Synaphobranchus kaupii]